MGQEDSVLSAVKGLLPRCEDMKLTIWTPPPCPHFGHQDNFFELLIGVLQMASSISFNSFLFQFFHSEHLPNLRHFNLIFLSYRYVLSVDQLMEEFGHLNSTAELHNDRNRTYLRFPGRRGACEFRMAEDVTTINYIPL